jgi:polar amino acid transport system substrate-binding protein
MTRRPFARLAVAVAVLLTASTLAACTDDSEPSSGPTTTAVPPTTAAPAAPAVQCNNAVASYAPDRPLSAPGTSLPSGSTMRAIQDRERLIVGVSADTLLFGARNPINGRLEGFDIDILREVAYAIFGGDKERIDERIEFRVITYAQRLPVLEDGSVDLVAHTMTINCARWERIAFSSEYYAAGQKLLVRTDSAVESVDTLDGERVCAAEGSTNIDNIAAYPVEVVGAPDLTDCLVLFQQGAVDAITGDDTVLAGFAAQDPYAKVIGAKFTDEPYGVGVNAEQVDLVQFVNSVLDQLRTNGRWQQIAKKWLEDAAPAAPPQPDESRPLP